MLRKEGGKGLFCLVKSKNTKETKTPKLAEGCAGDGWTRGATGSIRKVAQQLRQGAMEIRTKTPEERMGVINFGRKGWIWVSTEADSGISQ